LKVAELRRGNIGRLAILTKPMKTTERLCYC
jgi:hypothetical protein